MFTGIVQDVGRVEALSPRGGDVRLAIRVAVMAVVAKPDRIGQVDGAILFLFRPGFDTAESDVVADRLLGERFGARHAGDRAKQMRLPAAFAGHFEGFQ